MLQWGHGLSAVEMSGCHDVPYLSVKCFNGATAFQPWKFRTRAVIPRRTTGLQWGHGLSAVEIGSDPLPASRTSARFNGATAFQPWKWAHWWLRAPGDHELQWGHGLSAVEIKPDQASKCRQVRLQWGHGLSAVEIMRRPAHEVMDYLASMGPRPFSRGNSVPVMVLATRPQSFNGATAFQPWKYAAARL